MAQAVRAVLGVTESSLERGPGNRPRDGSREESALGRSAQPDDFGKAFPRHVASPFHLPEKDQPYRRFQDQRHRMTLVRGRSCTAILCRITRITLFRR